jgi:hypothetical protein
MKVKASEFDRAFESGEDVSRFLDSKNSRRPGLEQRRVNADFPAWVIEALDHEAARLGVTRQSLVKIWIAERLESGAAGSGRP